MRLRWRRFAAVLGFTLVPLCLGSVPPAMAGGGWGITVTATMDGQDQRLLVGTVHTVHVTVLDAPGEASLRDILVTVVDPDPTNFPVVCDAGANGRMSLEPMRALHCTAEVTALPGARMVVSTATATVPGVPGRLRGSATVRYFGYTLPPVVKPVVKPAVKPPVKSPSRAAAAPVRHEAPTKPAASGSVQGDPPADPPADPPVADPPGRNGGAGDDDPGCPGGNGGSGGSGRGPACSCPPGDGGEATVGGKCDCPTDDARRPGAAAASGCDCPPGSGTTAGSGCNCPPRSDAAAGSQHCECPTDAIDHCDPGQASAPAPRRLAHTGTDIALFGGVGLSLVGGGLLLARTTRRTRRSRG